MENQFFERPILNSPYDYPAHHWELDESGQPTQQVIDSRRGADFVTPIPRPRKRNGGGEQGDLALGDVGLSNDAQRYHRDLINGVRQQVDRWRLIPDPGQWHVTPETARLSQQHRRQRRILLRPPRLPSRRQRPPQVAQNHTEGRNQRRSLGDVEQRRFPVVRQTEFRPHRSQGHQPR